MRRGSRSHHRRRTPPWTIQANLILASGPWGRIEELENACMVVITASDGTILEGYEFPLQCCHKLAAMLNLASMNANNFQTMQKFFPEPLDNKRRIEP